MLKQLFSVDAKIEKEKERWQKVQKKFTSVQEYVDNLIEHINRMAELYAKKRGEKLNGRVFRIGITHLTPKGYLVPLPVKDKKSVQEKMFLHEFMIIPISETTLEPLLESGKGDSIPDMEAHLKKRGGKSVSSQIALQYGVKSNVRMPYHTIRNKGIIFFSADVPHFFHKELLEYIQSIVPDIEAFFNINNDFEVLVKAQEEFASREGDTLHNKKLMHQAKMILAPTHYPFTDRIKVEQTFFTQERLVSGNLSNLWKLDNHRLATLLIEAETYQVEAARMSLYLRGMFLKEATPEKRPSEVVRALEKYFWDYLETDAYLTSTEEQVSVFYGILDFNKDEMIYCNVGFLHPLLCCRKEQKVYALENTGLYFGSMDTYFEDETIPFHPTDRLLLATSEIVELVDEEAHLFGKEKLHSVLSGSVEKDFQTTCKLVHDVIHAKGSELKMRDAIFLLLERVK